jgi:hypothetical protein
MQVKSQASPQELKDYINQYGNMDQYASGSGETGSPTFVWAAIASNQ